MKNVEKDMIERLVVRHNWVIRHHGKDASFDAGYARAMRDAIAALCYAAEYDEDGAIIDVKLNTI